MDTQELNKEKFVREAVVSHTRRCPDFPTPGVTFLDFNQCFANAEVFNNLVSLFADKVEIGEGDVVLAPEARGFIIGPAIALRKKAGFIPLRKQGKLPDFGSLKTVFYDTEYSKAALCMDRSLGDSDFLSFKGKNIVIYDDVLATGGTASAAIELASMLSPKSIQLFFLAEIVPLKGREVLLRRELLTDNNIYSLVKF